ncbi:MAG: 2-hydroxychromene-2-carboxylate isomerase [Betaproteobacteria bacterium]
MRKIIDYYFSPVSPWTYLGHQRFADIATRHGVQVNVKPVDFGRIFAVSGGVPVKQRAPQRQAYRFVELARFRDHVNVPLNLEPKHFPAPADDAAMLIISADRRFGTAAAMSLMYAVLRACWAEERNIADRATLDQIAHAQGLDTAALVAERDQAKAVFDANTQEAIERQVFGAPTYVLNDELFWGQDRLEFLARALEKG